MALSDMEDSSAMMTETLSRRLTGKTAFSLAIAAYAVAWVGVFVFAFQVFGLGLAIGLSLILVFPLVIAVRMRCRWPAVREREFAFLLVLLIIVSGGGAFTIWHWYDSCMDLRHARYMQFEELTRIANADPAFHNIEFSIDNHNKCRHWISGSVVSQTDLERFHALCDQYGFLLDAKEVAVMDGSQRKNK